MVQQAMVQMVQVVQLALRLALKATCASLSTEALTTSFHYSSTPYKWYNWHQYCCTIICSMVMASAFIMYAMLQVSLSLSLSLHEI